MTGKPTSGPGGTDRPRRRQELLLLAAALVAVALASLHVAAIYTESINWDEFAILRRAADLVREGALQTGGRPGAAQIVLAPLVRGCEDAIEVAREARLIWFPIVVAGLAGLFELSKRILHGESARQSAAFCVCLLALVPAFLRWSLQVRTDPAAIALGVWGGVALLASARRWWLALVAGLLLGAGYLFTQKVVYVAVLDFAAAAYLLLRDADRSRWSSWLRLFGRLALASAVAAGILGIYRSIGGAVIQMPAALTLERGLAAFDYYRSTYGYSVYAGLTRVTRPHLVLLLCLAAATIRDAWARRLGVAHLGAWTFLALGFAVGAFHRAALPYFWMTLGLFFALGLTIALEVVLVHIPVRWRLVFPAALVLWLVLPALVYSMGLLRDTQRIQRETLDFITRNFAPSDAGFHAEGALFCRPDPDPFGVYFRQSFVYLSRDPEVESKAARLQRKFESKPVRFIISTGAMSAAPRPLIRFWRENYQPYFGPLMIPGRLLSGPAGGVETHTVVAPGIYRLLTALPTTGAAVRIAGSPLAGGETVALGSEPFTVEFLKDVPNARLVLALREPPLPILGSFYSGGAVLEMRGLW